MKNQIRIVRNEPNPKVPTPPDFDHVYQQLRKNRSASVRNRLIGGGLLLIAVITALLLFRPSAPAPRTAAVDTLAVKPPVPALDVAYDTFEINVAAGDTIVYKGCTRIVFGPGSIVGTNGSKVEKTRVLYREFQNQTEIMMSGIPMMYDTAGNSYLFESGGMFELRGLNTGEQIKDGGQVQVSMCTHHPQQNNNWYKLDRRTGKWSYIKPVVTDPVAEKDSRTLNDEQMVAEPEVRNRLMARDEPDMPPMLPPKRKDPANPTFSIEANYIPELQAYTNVEFEVLPGQGYDPARLPDDWDYIKVAPTETYGIYEVTLYRYKRKVSYRARPVFANEQDYNKALKDFRKKEEEQRERIAAEQKKADAEARERMAAAQRQARQEGNTIGTAGQNETPRADDVRSNAPTVSIPVQSFGYYNCDRPIRNMDQSVSLRIRITGLSSGQTIIPGVVYQYHLDRNAVMMHRNMKGFRMNYTTGESYLLVAFAQDHQGQQLVAVLSAEEWKRQVEGRTSAEVDLQLVDRRFRNQAEIDAWLREKFMGSLK